MSHTYMCISSCFRPVGMPRMEQVTVYNTDRNNNLHLLSISGSTAHFHCSFFQDKVSMPGQFVFVCNKYFYFSALKHTWCNHQ